MSKPNLEEITYALYVVAMNLNGKCPYCGDSLSGDKPKYKLSHFEENHQ